jgi:hypothetical protein
VELMANAAVTAAHIITRLRDNDAGSRDHVLAFIGALLKVFDGPGPTAAAATATLQRLDGYAFGSGAGVGGQAACKHHAALRRMGFQVGSADMPAPAAPYPYPPPAPYPNGPYPQQQQQQMQHVQVHEDPYMKTVAGLSVGAQCCQCCATYAIADAIAGDY